MRTKVLITGGAGFIGNHLVDRLIQQENEIIVYDNLSSGKQEFIKHHLEKPNFKFIKADLLNKDVLIDVMRGCEFVFHLAANPDIRHGIENTDIDLTQGTIVTYNVLDSMRICGVKKIVFSSSSVVYGEATIVPTPEDYGPLIPISLYGASKLACEGLITGYAHTFGMQCWIFRFANIIGKRETHGVIFDFINKLKNNPTKLEILGDGKQEKSYLLVEDCVDGILFGIKNAKEKVNIFNLGSNDRIMVGEIAKLLIEEMGIEAKFEYTGGHRGWPGDIPKFLLDVTKISKIGWRAKYNSREAVKKSIKILLEEQNIPCKHSF